MLLKYFEHHLKLDEMWHQNSMIFKPARNTLGYSYFIVSDKLTVLSVLYYVIRNEEGTINKKILKNFPS